jgi:hypothetical protein
LVRQYSGLRNAASTAGFFFFLADAMYPPSAV